MQLMFSARTRKIVFATCIYLGGFTSMLFYFLPFQAPAIQPYLAVILSMFSMNSYVIAVMCFTSWLPIIAKNICHPEPMDEESPQETDALLVRPLQAPTGLSGLMAKISSIGTTLDAAGSITVCVALQWLLDHTRVGVPSCLAALGLWWATLGTIPAILLPGPEDCPEVAKPRSHSPAELFMSLGKLPQMSKLLLAHFIACDCE